MKKVKQQRVHKIAHTDNGPSVNDPLFTGTVSWGSITNSSDTNNAYDNFIEIFSSLYDKHNNSWIKRESTDRLKENKNCMKNS